MSDVTSIPMPWGEMAVHDRPGRGPALLFLHGTGCSSADFGAVLSALPGRRAMCLDFRGHGSSTTSRGDFTIDDLADDVVLALDALDVENVTLVGHSLGGMVGLAVAHRTPRINALVLLEGWTRLSVVRSAFGPEHMYGNLGEETVADVRQRSDAVKARYTKGRWDGFWRTVVEFDGGPVLDTLAIPIDQVYGGAGALADAQQHLGVPHRPNIHWHWVPGAGHYLPLETPGEVARVCARAADRIAR